MTTVKAFTFFFPDLFDIRLDTLTKLLHSGITVKYVCAGGGSSSEEL